MQTRKSLGIDPDGDLSYEFYGLAPHRVLAVCIAGWDPGIRFIFIKYIIIPGLYEYVISLIYGYQ